MIPVIRETAVLDFARVLLEKTTVAKDLSDEQRVAVKEMVQADLLEPING